MPRKAAHGPLTGIGEKWSRTVPLRGPAQPKSRARTSNLTPNLRLRGRRVLARLFEKDV